MLLNDTRTDRMQLTAQQRDELTAHVKKWANIDGDYEATMLGGIWHYRCDSGIFEDALSVADREWIEANTTDCLLYTSPSPRDRTRSRMPSSA